MKLCFSFSGIALNNTGNAQVRFRLACQPCNCYLLPINGFSLCSLPLEGKLSSICETDEVFINASDNLDFPPLPSFALRNPPSPQGEGFLPKTLFKNRQYFFSVHRLSLFWTTRLSRGFRYTRNCAVFSMITAQLLIFVLVFSKFVKFCNWNFLAVERLWKRK